MDVTTFRAEFPEFSNTAKYPDAQITFWATLAEQQVVADLWGTVWATGVKLYVAHELTIAAQNLKASSTGGFPGQSGGIPVDKTVGGASISYDAETTSEKNAGWWNLTTYGKQFIRLARMFGAGCVQL